MQYIVIIPTYNEADNIEATVKALEDVFRNCGNHETGILVVDDTSPDGTSDVVKKLQKNHKDLDLLQRKKKNGLGAAYTEAMGYAFSNLNADAIITFDADLSHDPRIIPEMINKHNDGYKQVIGTRYSKGGGIPDEWGFHRKLLSYFSNKFVSFLYLGSKVTDFTSGYKLISKEIYKKNYKEWNKQKGYTFAVSTNIQTLRLGYEIYEIPYKFRERKTGESKMGMEYFFNALYFVLKCRFEDIIRMRVGKVIIAGLAGSITQFLFYGVLFRPFIEYRNIFSLSKEMNFFGIADFDPSALLALALAIESGIFASFVVNNKWTFSDAKLTGFTFWRRYLKNHLVVIGAIIIQLVIFQLLSMIMGRGNILDYFHQGVGIFVGLIWNYYFYKKIIWKVSK